MKYHQHLFERPAPTPDQKITAAIMGKLVDRFWSDHPDLQDTMLQEVMMYGNLTPETQVALRDAVAASFTNGERS